MQRANLCNKIQREKKFTRAREETDSFIKGAV